MAKKEKTGVLSARDIFGYAIGDTGGVLAFGTIGSFLQMFYTDVIGISLAKITILMLVARIWDAINDPLCGMIIDRLKPTKHGRFRPYIFWFSLPMAIAFILMFWKIPGLSDNQYLIYAYVTYILYGMLYTAVNVPYGSLASVMTDDRHERSTLSVARSLGSGIGSLPGKILLPLFVYSTAVDTGAKYLDASKLFWAVVLLAGFMVIIYFASYRLTKENFAPAPQENVHVGKTVAQLCKNRPFVTLSIAALLLLAADMYVLTVMNYLFKNYFNEPGLYALVTVANYLPMLLLMPFSGKLVMKFGKKALCAFGSIFAAAAYFIMFIIHTKNPYIFLALNIISGFGVSFFTLEVWAMVNDVIDWQEKLSGRREEATTFASFTFFRKLGQTLAGICAPMAMAAIGYSTAHDAIAHQTEAVNLGIYNISTIVPCIMYVVMFLLLQFGYTLGKNEVEALKEELHARRGNPSSNI